MSLQFVKASTSDALTLNGIEQNRCAMACLGCVQ